MLLLIDIGNTKIKWRFDAQGSPGCVHRLLHQGDLAAAYRAIAATKPNGASIASAYVASVLGSVTDSLCSALKESLAVSVHNYVPTHEEGGFVGCYPLPHKLGVDRWLAIMEAWNRHGASIVVDCGTAITVDAANEHGQHLGGYIVPGFSMHFAALAAGTTQVQVSDSSVSALHLGCDTEAAVRNGVVRMVVAFINSAVKGLQAELGNPAIYLLGGDACRVAKHLDFTVLQGGNLILDGLARVAQSRQG